MIRALKLNDNDTVATVLADTPCGELVLVADDTKKLVMQLSAKENIPEGHKISLVSSEKGDPVFKYGQIISRTSQTIAPGEWVHIHNTESERGRGDA